MRRVAPTVVVLASALTLVAAGSTSVDTQGQPIDDVKNMLRGMLGRLQSEAPVPRKDEWCTSEMKRTTQRLGEKKRQLESMAAKCDKAEAMLGQLVIKRRDLSSKLADLAHKTISRSTEHEQAADKISGELKGHEEAQSRLTHALQVLRKEHVLDVVNDPNFGSTEDWMSVDVSMPSESFMQRRNAEPVMPKAAVDALVKARTMAPSAIPVVQAARDASFRAKVHLEGEAHDLDFHFKREVKKREEVRDRTQKELEDLDSEEVHLKHQFSQLTRDKQLVAEQKDALLSYSHKLRPSCMTGTSAREERVARRDRQIESLKDAHEVLAGDGIPDLS